VFWSHATNLVAGDTNGDDDIFVKDLNSGLLTRVSTDSNGVQGNSGSHVPVFSPDGTQIAFQSDATNLVAGDTNNSRDIFLATLPVSNFGIDTINASVSYTLPSNVENLTLLGNESLSGAGNELDNIIAGSGGGDYLSGNEGNDTISGLDGNDYIDGGVGDDVLVGNAGNDYLSGGDGNNTYIYTEGHDNINNEEYPSANEDFGFGDTLILSTLTRQQVIFSQDVQNASMLVIQVQGSDQHSVRLNGFFDVIGTAGPSTLAPSANAVEKIVFADGEMLTASQVAAIIGNTAPVLINEVFRAEVDEDGSIILDLLANQPLTLSNVTLADPTQGKLSFLDSQEVVFTPAADFNGQVELSYKVSDGVESVIGQAIITVNAVNDAPSTLVPVDSQEINENQAFSYQLPNEAFIDLDGDVLTYSATLSDDSALPSWLSFDANTQTFSGTPSFDDAGVLAIKVTANDGQATASQTFTLDVLDVNRAPVVIEPVVNQSTNENQVFTYQLPSEAFIDLDGDVLT
jgi:hypothetical protein